MKENISTSISQVQEKILDLSTGKENIAEILSVLGLNNIKVPSAQLVALMDMLTDGITPVTEDLITTLLEISEAQKKFYYCIAGVLDQEIPKCTTVKDKSSKETVSCEFINDEVETTIPQESEIKEEIVKEEIQEPENAATKEDQSKTEQPKEEPKSTKNRKKDNSQAISSIRVSTSQLDSLIELVGKLMVTYAVISQTKTDNISTIYASLAEMDVVIRNLQSEVDEIRLVPLKQIFMPMHRLVKSTSQKVNKRIKFIVEGEDLALDKTIVESLNEPLVHLLRNALDHGIEPNEDRIMAGKDEIGTVKLSATRQGDFAYLKITDDGKGLDPEALLQKALERGIADPEKEYTDEETYQFIMQSGFSTASAVTDISGRGVGMDAVVTSIRDTLDGTVTIDSKLGSGSTFTITIPLSKSVNEGIVDALITQVGEDIFIFPSRDVLEVYEPVENEFTKLPDGRETVAIRGSVYPLIRIDNSFNINKKSGKVFEKAILVKIGSKKAAVLVDEVLRQQKAVVTGFTLPVQNIYDIPILGFGMMGESDALVINTEELVNNFKIEQ